MRKITTFGVPSGGRRVSIGGNVASGSFAASAMTAEPAAQTFESQRETSGATQAIELESADGGEIMAIPESIYSSTDPRDTFDAGYSNGMFLRLEENRDSFELKANFRSQFRLVSFTANEDTWTDSTGAVRPVDDRQNFELARARLIFSGHAFTPQFKFFMQMDGIEMMDATEGGSGFSFDDLAADRAGTLLAIAATKNTANARNLQTLVG